MTLSKELKKEMFWMMLLSSVWMNAPGYCIARAKLHFTYPGSARKRRSWRRYALIGRLAGPIRDLA